MKTIHKTIVAIADSQHISAPKGSSFLSAQIQHGALCLWYACDTEQKMISRRVAIAGTGYDATHCEGLRFLGTVQLAEGALVFHVFVED